MRLNKRAGGRYSLRVWLSLKRKRALGMELMRVGVVNGSELVRMSSIISHRLVGSTEPPLTLGLISYLGISFEFDPLSMLFAITRGRGRDFITVSYWVGRIQNSFTSSYRTEALLLDCASG